ncbi:MAG: toll/interleukin-1 receptor domain-containing protein [Anaerolineae bacterium]|nr:toll/interleukin-1 receptor domain-containing protein [Anaerolineae bacterium]GIK27097.1 MAG: hypothetical protein BroJett007_02350 [Chloroflexota bacterium]
MPDQPLSLFISYKRVDSAFVDRLEVDLRVRGFDTWLDRRDLASRGGANWRRELQIAIDRAHALVLVLTPDAAASPYVGWEYRYAVAIGRPIYVLLLRDCPSGVPQEILADSIHWFDFRGEPSYPQRLALLVDHLMDLPTDAPPPRPSDVKFADDSPIVLKPAGAIEMRRPTPKSDAQLDDLYRRAVKAEVAGQLDRATDLFHRIIDANPTYRNNFIANRMPELLRKRTEVWIERLKKIAYQARLEGEWGLEIAAWNAMVTETNGDPRAHKGLELAKHNQSFAWLYKEALSLYNSGDIASAKHQLDQLWQHAPDYGDPAKLAPELGLPTRQVRESTGMVRPDIVRAAQSEYEKMTRSPSVRETPPVRMPSPTETDELDALFVGAVQQAAGLALLPGEHVLSQHGINLYSSMMWAQRTLYLTNQRILMPAPVMAVINRADIGFSLRDIVDIRRDTVLFVNPVVKITLRDGAEHKFILMELGGLLYGNREQFIALVNQVRAAL